MFFVAGTRSLNHARETLVTLAYGVVLTQLTAPSCCSLVDANTLTLPLSLTYNSLRRAQIALSRERPPFSRWKRCSRGDRVTPPVTRRWGQVLTKWW